MIDNTAQTASMERLAALGSNALGPTVTEADISHLPCLLARFLAVKNGFYAFESALHVFPASGVISKREITVEEWNRPSLWRGSYGRCVDVDHFFFAEDIFGGQFSLTKNGVYEMDPETGDIERVSEDLESWATKVLSHAERVTGHPVAHEWQSVHGPLAPGKRLVAKVPFVLGGEFAVSNLRVMDSVDGMTARGELAQQIVGLPDGAPIKLTFDDQEKGNR
jgi:hypothetical protein